MPRPFLSWSIVQLEAEFDRARLDGDATALTRLLHELGFRETRRAQSLKERVVQAVGVTRSQSDSSSEARHHTSDQPGPVRPAEQAAESAQTSSEQEHTDLPPPRPPRTTVPRRAPWRSSATFAPSVPPQLTQTEIGRLLSAWTALEVLSPPQTYVNPKNLGDGVNSVAVDFRDTVDLPWERGAKAKPNTRLFYHVVLGAIAMEGATSKLLEIYSDDDIERMSARGFAPIAMLTVDSKGVPLTPDAIAISSFAWGLPLALRKELSALGRWPQVEDELIASADKLVRRTDDDDQPLPVDRATIEKLYAHLLQTLDLPRDFASEPEFALRVYQWWRATEPPEPPPMGSFFLEDLARAKSLVEAGSVPPLLERYLNARLPTRRIDLRLDDTHLAEAVSPSRMPAGRWPASGGHPLVVLQQAAVNLATDAAAPSNLLPVNGPPGTGKTTLLRDVVVASVVARARVLARLSEPADAFAASDAKVQTGNAFIYHYPLDVSLRGFELVVASSNNKAVENVSAELPSMSAIDEKRADLRYFKSVADNVARGPRRGGQTGDRQGSLFEKTEAFAESWGLIAGVLGNASNRFAFRQTAWADPDSGLKAYLMEASGNPQTISTTDPKTGRVIESRKPRVVTIEKPPTSVEDARRRWKAAVREFKEAVGRVDARLATMEKGRQALTSPELSERLREARERVRGLEGQIAELLSKEGEVVAALDRLKAARAAAQSALVVHERTRPGLLSRMLSSSPHAAWYAQRIDLAQSLQDAVTRLTSVERAVATIRDAKAAGQVQLDSARRAESSAASAIENVARDLNAAIGLSGSRFADAAFFEREPEDLHRDTAWLDEETLRMREDVFIAAMQLHRAFVDGAAKQIRNNLDLLFRTFFGRAAWSPKMRPLMPSLWATFFSVVPVVSTTFASVERMFGAVDAQSLGLLLIDEAGQAVPQAAVGALMRAKRAVVVGDPIQLPPVTSLPTELADQIAKKFGVDSERLIAPAASVQKLSDAASQVGTTVDSDGNKVWVGVPLVVHRRCAEPMFSLSNNMAYGGMMVQGRGAKRSTIRDVLGPSTWIDVRPDRCEDKWSEAEGRTVLDLLRKLDRAGIADLDMYLISPFRIVAQNLRALLVAERVLQRWTSNPREWVKDRIGTVYTVQGREADTVLMVLGAAEPQRKGARNWAGQGVNQLNVAVTRAKENLYVIGNRFEWASAGKFAHLELQFERRAPSL